MLLLFILDSNGGGISCFSPLRLSSPRHRQPTIRHHRYEKTVNSRINRSTVTNSRTDTRLGAFWNRKKKKNAEEDKKNKNNDTNDINDSDYLSSLSNGQQQSQSQQADPSGMGRTVSTMENFKQTQELGKRTNALLSDLASTTVEGLGPVPATASGVGVRVSYNGNQEPVGVEVDEGYLEGLGSVEELNEALTLAMRDAWGKSLGVMEDKMQSLYSELGLPSAKQ